MSDIDQTKDYYRALGLTINATNDELKSAYIQLALQHHPDTFLSQSSTISVNKSVTNDEFIKISEAWSVLSKQDTRIQYDLLRKSYLGINNNNSSSNSLQNNLQYNRNGSVNVSVNYNTQKALYNNSVKHKASSNWEDLKEKYKSEKWQNMPLTEKKINRSIPIQSSRGSILAITIVCLGSILIYKNQSALR